MERDEYQTAPYPVSCYVTAMIPTIGRIVHYTNLGDRDGKFPPEVQAAIITGVNSRAAGEHHTVALHVFYRTGQFDMQAVEFTEEPAGSEGARGKWCWPVTR